MKSLKLCALTLSASLALLAEAIPSKIFADHAVLHQSKNTPVFGKANPGEDVTVTIAGKKATTKANAEGKWLVRLDISNVGHGPFTMTVNDKTYKDILVGEVWLCSGQSNMEFRLSSEQNAKDIIAKSTNPKIRLFDMPRVASTTPLDDVQGSWKLCDPTTVPSFSAVGYLFGRDIHAVIKKPIGLIDNSWGGSAAEAWLSKEALAKTPPKSVQWTESSLNAYLTFEQRADKFLADNEKWLAAVGRTEPTETQPPQNATWTKDVALQNCTLPGNSVVWLKAPFALSNEARKRDYRIRLSKLSAPFAFFLDGKLLATSNFKQTVYGDPVDIVIKANTLSAGKHEVTLRLWCTEHRHKITSRPVLTYGPLARKIWQMTHTPLPKLTRQQEKDRPRRPWYRSAPSHVPAQLFNALIYPLFPYAINGCLWYQGCTNSGRYDTYPAVIQALIKEWRKGFESEFPFYYCQLASYKAKDNNPNNAGWANIRRGQEGALELPKTGQAILIDVGEAVDIHPIDKETVSARLAAIALNKTYGFKDLPYSGPIAKATTIEGNKIRVSFDFIHGGLVAKPVPDFHWLVKARKQKEKLVRNSPNSQLEGFAIAGADGKFFWADATIDGDTVVVSSPNVPKPVKVRYAWQSNPTCNLFNKAGFPAAPFEK